MIGVTGPSTRTGRTTSDFTGEVVILSRRGESDGVISLELGLASGEPLPPWDPGAHIDLLLPNGLSRQYSLCGRVADEKTWRIGVLRESESRGGSAWIHDHAREGERLQAQGVRNHFPLHDGRKYLFIAGGIGITPLLPMIAQVHAAGADWQLYYGGRVRGSKTPGSTS